MYTAEDDLHDALCICERCIGGPFESRSNEESQTFLWNRFEIQVDPIPMLSESPSISTATSIGDHSMPMPTGAASGIGTDVMKMMADIHEFTEVLETAKSQVAEAPSTTSVPIKTKVPMATEIEALAVRTPEIANTDEPMQAHVQAQPATLPAPNARYPDFCTQAAVKFPSGYGKGTDPCKLYYPLNYYVTASLEEEAQRCAATMLGYLKPRTIFARLFRLALENVGIAAPSVVKYVFDQYLAIEAGRKQRSKQPSNFEWENIGDSAATRVALFRSIRAITSAPNSRAVFDAVASVVTPLGDIDICEKETGVAVTGYLQAIANSMMDKAIAHMPGIAKKKKIIEKAIGLIPTAMSAGIGAERREIVNTAIAICKKFKHVKWTGLLTELLACFATMVAASTDDVVPISPVNNVDADVSKVDALYTDVIAKKSFASEFALQDSNMAMLSSPMLGRYLEKIEALASHRSDVKSDERYHSMALQRARFVTDKRIRTYTVGGIVIERTRAPSPERKRTVSVGCETRNAKRRKPASKSKSKYSSGNEEEVEEKKHRHHHEKERCDERKHHRRNESDRHAKAKRKEKKHLRHKESKQHVHGERKHHKK
jgi:hypothetical protein